MNANPANDNSSRTAKLSTRISPSTRPICSVLIAWPLLWSSAKKNCRIVPPRLSAASKSFSKPIVKWERKQIQERAAAMENAVDRLRELEEKLTEEKVHLDQWSQELNKQAAQQAEEADALEARAKRIVEEEQKVADDRSALRERETALVQAEQAREALQEQLRRRSEELAVRQRDLVEQTRLFAEQETDLHARRTEMDQTQTQAGQRLASLQ